MDDLTKDKLIKFANDKVMNQAVFNILLNTFIKPKPRAEVGVGGLAAARIAINLLTEAWKEVDKYYAINEEKADKPKQIGL